MSSPSDDDCNGKLIGLDIGGTLVKCVIFECRPDEVEGGSPKNPTLRRVSVNRTYSYDFEGSWGEDEVTQQKRVERLNNLNQKGGKIIQWLKSSVTYGSTGSRDMHMQFYSPVLKGTFHFIRFETDKMQGAMQLVRRAGLAVEVQEIACCGGGSYKFAPHILDELGVRLVQIDELHALLSGMIFLSVHSQEELFSLELTSGDTDDREIAYEVETVCTSEANRRGDPNELYWLKNSKTRSPLFPFLVVNVGSGVSIMRVNSPHDFQRVGGTACGGGMFFGLSSLLLGVDSFDEAMELASTGSRGELDLLVQDIYGKNYSGANLPGDTTAAFFAKAGNRSLEEINKGDLAYSLVNAISQNLTQIAYLYARLPAQQTNRIVFTGSFFRKNRVAMRRVTRNLELWASLSRTDPVEALFLKHEGYCGAMGSFLSNMS